MGFSLDLEATSVSVDDSGIKQAYAAPVLTLYGLVGTLTATGSGRAPESANPDGTCANGPRASHC